jgi:hypothetical protein
VLDSISLIDYDPHSMTEFISGCLKTISENEYKTYNYLLYVYITIERINMRSNK